MNPWLHARLLAFKRRFAMQFSGGFNPYPKPPDNIVLSPSAAHFIDYDNAVQVLSWQQYRGSDVSAWQREARAKLSEITGYEHRPYKPEVVADFPVPSGVDFERRHLYLRVRDGSDVPVDILRPRNAAGPLPVMICLQGTNSGAHLSWGEARMPADPGKIAAGADYGRQAVHQGFVAVCVEQAAFGERREVAMRKRSDDPCIDAANHALLLGRTLSGERASDISSVIDWLSMNADELCIDISRLSVMGSSSGGAVAIFAAALDERITSILANGCVGFIRDTIARRGDASGQNVIPGILSWIEMDDVLGLIAPRPLLVVSGDADHIWPYDGAAAVVDRARDVYRAFDRESEIVAVSAPGGHRFYPEIAWPHFVGLLSGNRAAGSLS
jgi:dienelactone hydrolase